MTQPPPLPPHPSDWAAGELKDDEWQARLGPAELEEIDAALAESAQQPPETLTRDSFRLPELGARLRTIRDALEEGRGLFLLRGLPVERWGPERTARAFHGLAAHVGTAVSQSAGGAPLLHVRDAGYAEGDPCLRGPSRIDASASLRTAAT